MTERGVSRSEIGIYREKIARIGRLGRKSRALAKRVIDASSCLVIPGAVDPHVHLQLDIAPGMRTADDFETGTRTAAAGGVTTIIDYTTPQPGQSPLEAFESRRKQAEGRAHVDYNLHNVLIGWERDWAEDLGRLVRLGSTSVKLFMIYAERGWQADDAMLIEVMEACRRLGIVVCIHAENDSLIGLYTSRQKEQGAGADGLAMARPPLTEAEAAARAIRFSEATGARLHLVHLSTAESARLVGAARRGGLQVSGETCPQYLALDKKLLAGNEGHLWGCCPPLRGRAERAGLMKALQRGWLQAIGTDHCTFTRKQKDTWDGDFTLIPYGLPGLETSLPVTYTIGPGRDRLPVTQWVKLHTAGPASLFGLYPRKGTLRKGSDADIVIWDPGVKRDFKAEQLQGACDWNPFSRMRVSGIARHVLLRGREIAAEGRYSGPGGEGLYQLRRRAARSH